MSKTRGRKSFAIRLGEIRERADVNYAAASHKIRTLYADPQAPLVPIGNFARDVQYGTSALAHTEPDGVPVLRMNNLQNDGWDLSDLKYIELSPSQLERYRLNQGDILFNRTNGSKELVGKCEVFRENGDWVFASYLIRLKLDESKALPEFIAGFLNTEAGRAQVERVSRQILMSNINAEEIRELVVPLPPLEMQRELADVLLAAKDARDRKIARAEELIRGIDDYLLNRLGIAAPPEAGPNTFAVRLKQLIGRRLDPPAYRPLLTPEELPELKTLPLGSIADIDANKSPKIFEAGDLVPYVGLPECTQTAVREVAMRPFSEVKGRGVVMPGDILFARIEPSVFNKKYVLADELHGHGFAFTSTEFYTVRAKEEVLSQLYLYAMFFCSFVFAQVKGKTTGSSGRRRIDANLFADVQIPIPTREVQEAIISEITSRRATAKRLTEEAAEHWAAAKSELESRLLGRSGPR